MQAFGDFAVYALVVIGAMRRGYTRPDLGAPQFFVRRRSYLDTYLQMAGSLIAFTFAANALVRFRGTHDRISLILAFGFVLAGLIEAGTSMTFYRGMLVKAASQTFRSAGSPGEPCLECCCWRRWLWSGEFRWRAIRRRKWLARR